MIERAIARLHPRTRPLAFGALIAFGVALCGLAAACGGGGSDHDQALLLVRHEDTRINIVRRAFVDGVETVFARPEEPSSSFIDPALSPDGARVAFVNHVRLVSTDRRLVVGADLWIAASDGADARVLSARTRPNEILIAPQWRNDSTVYAIVRVSLAANVAEGTTYTLTSIDASSGARTSLIEGVVAFAVSRDGTQLAYTTRDESGDALYLADADGTNARLRISDADGVSPLTSPVFSPDGTQIAFSAVDILGGVADGARLASARPFAAPARHGLPQDIWVMDVAGGAARLVADIDEDEPAIAWSSDGARLYVFGPKALSEVDLNTGVVTELAPGVGHSQIAVIPAD